jgi:hypothetical protein
MDHNCFKDVAPHLANAVDKPYGFSARTVLRERAMRYIDIACQSRDVEKLFKFWGTDVESYREQARTRLAEAQTCAETVRAIEPLLGLCDKTICFGDAVSRLQSLSLSCDHRHSPGFVIAQTLARGLGEDHAGWVVFAKQYIAALETLVFEIRLDTTSTYTIRKEVSDRATMSTSAAEYLVQILDESSSQRAILSQRIGIQPAWLQEEFCGGLASVDSIACHRRVGKVHIVDMLTRSLSEWPDAPSNGVVEKLVADTKKTAVAGDKPKALALLDALKACRELPSHGLRVQAGLGQRLGQRLYTAASEAPNSRVYHPARSVHDKLVMLIDMGIPPEHDAFPRQLLEDYLRGVAQITSDEQRLALDRYLRILRRLDAAGLSLEQPGTGRFTLAMRDCLTTRHDLLAAGVAQLEGLSSRYSTKADKTDPKGMDHALAEWTSEVLPLATLTK